MSYSSHTRLDGRVAVVTGGARGIGFETVKALQESGAQTVIVDISTELGQKASKELETAFLQADLTKSEEVKKVADQVQERYDGSMSPSTTQGSASTFLLKIVRMRIG